MIDTSIVNVALTDIQGNLGVDLSEIGWVSTGYTIANVIMIPLTAWLGQRFGRKRYFIFSLIGFTIASAMCGLAANLTMLVASRVLQGLCGGGLLAKAQTILFETFPPAEQGLAQSVFGVGVIAGPAIGPVLGGFLTDTLSWRWIFFVNLPFGVLAVVMATLFLPADPSYPRRGQVDWWGICFLVLMIGSFQVVLEEGQRYSWFESTWLRNLMVVGTGGMGLFIWQELRVRHPAVDLRVLTYPSVAAGSLYSTVMGMGLYGTLFAVPLFTQSILQFTALETGLLLAPGALASATVMVLLGKISNWVDARLLITAGACGSALVMFSLASINPQTGPDDLFWPLVFRGGTAVMLFLPLSLATLSPLPRAKIAAGSGFYNLTRQLGGSLGIALLTTIIQQREAFHRAILVEHLQIASPNTLGRLSLLTELFQQQGSDPHTAYFRALDVIDETVNQQAAVMSFADCFWLVGWMFLVSLPLVVFLGRGAKQGGGDVSVH